MYFLINSLLITVLVSSLPKPLCLQASCTVLGPQLLLSRWKADKNTSYVLLKYLTFYIQGAIITIRVNAFWLDFWMKCFTF